MKTKHPFLFAFVMILLAGCSKDNKLSKLSNIYVTDRSGNPLGGDLSDGQWQSKEFTQAEMVLFSGLDTASLSGTAKPTSVNVRNAFPNPFVDYTGVPLSMNPEFKGQVVLKYVVVNRLLQVVQKRAQRLQAGPSGYFSVPGTFPSGYYRLYFTLSAEEQEHFYKSWGNIRRD